MTNKVAFTIGRIIFAVPFLVFGLNHMMMAEQMVSMVPGFFPMGLYWVYFTGLALMGAGISIIAQRYMKWACYGLMFFLAVVIGTIHVPMMMGENMQMAFVSILKDFGLFGAALILSTLDK